MTKAIAFDFVGVLGKENDFQLDPIEDKLERKFGILNQDKDFINWAVQETGLSKEGVWNKVKYIIDNIYDLREPDLFEKLPNLKYSTATNHLSYLQEWIKNQPIAKHFDYFVNSALIGYEKPQEEFYKTLAETIQEEPENILFIDDKIENCKTAEEFGMQTIHYTQSAPLSEIILKTLPFRAYNNQS